jgi:hypothetical protein
MKVYHFAPSESSRLPTSLAGKDWQGQLPLGSVRTTSRLVTLEHRGNVAAVFTFREIQRSGGRIFLGQQLIEGRGQMQPPNFSGADLILCTDVVERAERIIKEMHRKTSGIEKGPSKELLSIRMFLDILAWHLDGEAAARARDAKTQQRIVSLKLRANRIFALCVQKLKNSGAQIDFDFNVSGFDNPNRTFNFDIIEPKAISFAKSDREACRAILKKSLELLNLISDKLLRLDDKRTYLVLHNTTAVIAYFSDTLAIEEWQKERRK